MCNVSNNLEPIEFSKQNYVSVFDSDKFGFLEAIIQFPSKGKLQSFVFFATCLPLAILAFAIGILFIPFWLPATIYQSKKENKE